MRREASRLALGQRGRAWGGVPAPSRPRGAAAWTWPGAASPAGSGCAWRRSCSRPSPEAGAGAGARCASGSVAVRMATGAFRREESPLRAEPDLLAARVHRPRGPGVQKRAPPGEAAREQPGHILRAHAQAVIEEEVLQRVRHIPRALEAGHRIRRQGPGDDAPQRRGHARHGHHRLHVEGGDVAQDLEVVRAVEQLLAGEQLVEQQPQQEEIRALIHRRAAHLLGGEVAHLALHHAHLGAALDVGGLGDAEVGELHLAGGGDHHVGRVDVAVDDVERPAGRIELLVGVGQALGHLLDDEAHLAQAQRHLLGGGGALERAEVLSVHELHHHVVLAVARSPDRTPGRRWRAAARR